MLASAAKATHAQTRRHNNRLVFQRVYEQGPLSRADIARATNLTATTVSTVIGELLEEGLVAELGAISTERGKPPTLVSLAKDARHILALDLSRKAFQGSILNLRGEIQQSRRLAVADCQGEVALTAIYTLIDALMASTTTPILGIGVGAPGIIDPNSSLIRRAANLNWYDLPLGALLSQRYGCYVQVVNDNQAALLAEYLFGEYKHTPDLVVIRIGNGIGAGIMCNGQLLHGSGVGEIGHVVVVEQGERCSCGNDGCLETVASSRALVKQAQTLARRDPDCRLNSLVASVDEITIETVVAALFQQGDAGVTALVIAAGEQLGKVLAHLVSVLGPPRILLCGSLTGFGQTLIDVIQAEVAQRCLIGRLSAPQISLVTLTSDLSDLVVMGAAATILANELGLFW